jgi:hypothetical protein
METAERQRIVEILGFWFGDWDENARSPRTTRW